MKVLQINSIYPVKSTGRIARQIADICKAEGIETYIACGESTVSDEKVFVMGSRLYTRLNILKTRLFGKHGFYNKSATRRLLRWIDAVKPDVIHLHNIHGHYINVKLLFDYINKHNIPVVWTLHDCWAFTGHCAHFDYAGCKKWLTGCGNCPMQKSYPVSWFFDRSKGNYKAKKALFTSIEKMHIVTPSDWLKGLCEKSFLGKYPVTAIHNGIDTEVFAPAASDLRKELGIENKFVILGILKSFSGYKGGEHFLKLADMLSEDEVMVIAGLEEDVAEISDKIILLPQITDDKKLSQVYSMADVFVNPTLQDTFPTINIESIACGTPVVTFSTGGAAEMLDADSGISVARGDVKALYEAVCKVKKGGLKPSDCRARALKFKSEDCFSKYLEIYKAVSDM